MIRKRPAASRHRGQWQIGSVPSWLPWLVVAFGALLRLGRFLNNRSFWLDESLLGLNVIEKSFRELLGSLDYVQSAPTGFLLIEKASLELFGQSEQSLRLFPLLASLFGLVLFAVVARRLLPPWAALLSLALFVVNEPVLYQSSEAKPYSSDVAIALLLIWLTCLAVDGDGIGFVRIVPLAVAGVIVVWISYPSIFVLAAAVATLFLRTQPSGRRRVLAMLAPIGALWAISFLILYSVTSRNITTVSASVFAGDIHSSDRLEGLARNGWVALVDPGGFLTSMRGIAFLCLLVGIVALSMLDRLDRLTLLVGPGILAIVAAALSRYPFGGRFSLFLVPSLLFLVGRGAYEIVIASRRRWLIGLPLILLLVGAPVGKALEHVPDPTKREHIRPLLLQLKREWRPGDRIYLYSTAQYAVRFYAECGDCGVGRLPFPVRPAPAGLKNDGLPAALESSGATLVAQSAPLTVELQQLETLRGHDRVWILFAHALDQSVFVAYLDTIGLLRASFSEPGASLYLYNLKGVARRDVGQVRP